MAYNNNTLFGDRALGPITYEQVQPLIKWVYAWMGVGLLVTAVVALLTVNTPALLALATNGIVLIGALIVQIVLVIALSWAISRMTPGVAAAMFMAYSGLTGFTLSIIFLVYTTTSIVSAFVTASLLFAVMSVFAFTTKRDLTKFGSYLLMALIGFVIASVVNMFLQSGPLSFIISLVGVVIFLGLTAYDTQRIKAMAASPELQADPSLAARLSIVSALSLYLNLINLFLLILNLTGDRE
ncbi:MAG: Bax inhibitor-1/YccA family protein [Chloroflexi bacterium]|nr:Bax inhibitor-1/YccA family protein [Chloroflexota bacterium]